MTAPTEPTAPTGPQGGAPTEPAPTPESQQADTDWRAEARKWERRAKANDARASGLIQQVGQALGLTDAPTDPAVIQGQLQEMQHDAASARLELDVFRRIGRLGGDPDSLLDSMRFREAMDDVDPDKDWGEQADALIKDWLAKNPGHRAGGGPSAVTVTGRPVEALRSGALPASGAQQVDMNAWMRGRR